jgi:hypothetical protein
MQKKMITIVSDNEAGLILAALLENAGQSVTLIDTGDQVLSKLGQNQAALPFFPNTPELTQALSVLRDLCAKVSNNETVPFETVTAESAPLTLDGGTLVSFVGFGDSKSPAVPMLSRLNIPEQLLMTGSLTECLAVLRSNLKAKAHAFSELTRIEWAAGKVEKILINGNQEIFSDLFVFLISPREYLNFLNSDELGGRVRSRIAKTPNLARLTLEYQHNQSPETVPAAQPVGRNPIFLVPNQADQAPCVGLIFAEKQSSTWETYIENELSEDAEYVSSVLKTMKRLIRRAIPGLEEKPKEFLTVTTSAAADFSWIYEAKDLHELAANMLFSPTLAMPGTGMAQCIIAAVDAYTKTISSLQIETADSNSLPPPAALC